MFGYVTPEKNELKVRELARYRAYYCGLCRALKKRYGQIGRMTLSNDMTFLCVLLSSLYEPKETSGDIHCALHPLKKRAYVSDEMTDYAADMNLLLAYYKCLDNSKDDHDPIQSTRAKMLAKGFRHVKKLYPKKCELISEYLERIGVMEDQKSTNVDALCNLSGLMLGEIFAWHEDHWADTLRETGAGLGRFIYFMDAYEDYDADKRLRRFNPLTELHEMPDYEAFCKDTLNLLIADATSAFETLPLEQDIDILRNVLYSGVWSRYARMHARDKKAKEQPDGQ